jgi:hypothetical protein
MFEIGSSLREARVRQGLDFPELEQATKFRGKYLRALEEEEFELLPAPTFVNGFLRSYAEYLGLDGQLYMDEFNSRYVVGEETSSSRPRRSTPPSARPRFQSRVVVFALLGIALVTALVIVAWTRGSAKTQLIPGLATGTTPTTAAKGTATHNVVVPVARLTVVAVHGPSLLLVHRGSINGALVFQGTLDRGQRERFVGRRLWIEVSRPENLRMILNHHVRKLPTGSPKTLVVTPRTILPAA